MSRNQNYKKTHFGDDRMHIKIRSKTMFCDKCEQDVEHWIFYSAEKDAKVSICKNCKCEEVGKKEEHPTLAK